MTHFDLLWMQDWIRLQFDPIPPVRTSTKASRLPTITWSIARLTSKTAPA